MTGRIELIHGDMFDGPNDLIVIPCSNIPTITWFVADRLRNFEIPIPDRAMKIGEVIFCELSAAAQVAPFAAYATSVKAPGNSSYEAIDSIGRQLGQYANHHNNVKSIACPLLGTGAGRLNADKAVRALTSGFLETAPEYAVLRVYMLDRAAFENLKKAITDDATADADDLALADKPIRVFISYTRTTPAHAAWVLRLAALLRNNGLNSRLDQWHLRPGMDVAQWMCNELDLADRVVLICDELYSQKADRRHGGVGWEIRIVQGDLLQAQEDNPDKYIPVVVTPEIEKGTPTFLRSVYSIHWPVGSSDNGDKLNDLVRALYRAQSEPPPIGHPPSFVLKRASTRKYD